MTRDPPDVHLVDGTYELFRAYHGAPGARSPGGREMGAVRVLARSLLLLVREQGATHVGVAFDHVIESFRNELFEGYKTGEGLDEDLVAQFEPAERMCLALGFVVWPMVEFECDDALATAAKRLAGERGIGRVLICSPDKDLAQCVRGERVLCLDRLRGKQLDEAGVRAKFGVDPASIPDWLALVGDAADGIPGIPRWGAGSASKVLAEYGHLEKIPDDPSLWRVPVRGVAALADGLAKRREEAMLYRTLATLRTDVPIDVSIEALAWSGALRGDLEALCREIGDGRLVERVPRWSE